MVVCVGGGEEGEGDGFRAHLRRRFFLFLKALPSHGNMEANRVKSVQVFGRKVRISHRTADTQRC